MVQFWKENYKDSVGGHGSVALGFLGSALGARQLGDDSWDLFSAACFPQILQAANSNGTYKIIPERDSIPKEGGHLALFAGGDLRFLGADLGLLLLGHDDLPPQAIVVVP